MIIFVFDNEFSDWAGNDSQKIPDEYFHVKEKRVFRRSITKPFETKNSNHMCVECIPFINNCV